MPRGPKPKPAIWTPNQVEMRLPAATHLWGIEDSLMEEVVNWLINLSFECPPRDIYTASLFSEIRCVIAEVVKKKYKKDIVLTGNCKPIKGKAKERQRHREEATLLIKLLNIVQEVHFVFPCGYSCPAEWWARCVVDGHWAHVIPDPEKELGRSATAKDVVRRFQHQTRLLNDRQNPFAEELLRERHHDTRVLFDAAIKLVEPFTGRQEDSDGLWLTMYIPYLNARRQLTKSQGKATSEFKSYRDNKRVK